jgi:hypothetical protein
MPFTSVISTYGTFHYRLTTVCSVTYSLQAFKTYVYAGTDAGHITETLFMAVSLLAILHQPLPRAVTVHASIVKTPLARGWVYSSETAARIIHGKGWKDIVMVSGGVVLN